MKNPRAAVALTFVVVLLTGASVGEAKQSVRAGGPLARAITLQDRYAPSLLDRAGVAGTAVTENRRGEPVIKVFTKRRGVAVRKRLASVKVNRDVTGPITALHHRAGHNGGPGGGGGDKGGLAPTDRWPRPVPIGTSTGNEVECSSGTIGARVSGPGGIYALSNNHVYAAENDAPIGSAVLQPGRFDTGCAIDPADVIGTLADFEPMRFDGSDNLIDAAIAQVGGNVGTATPPGGYGAPSGNVVAPAIGQPIQKYGRTTGQTEGTVTAINATVNVGYTNGTARFVDQVIVEGRKPFLKSGDSGSLAVTKPARDAIGLLFAGNSSGKFSVANEIQTVLNAFGVTIDS